MSLESWSIEMRFYF